MNRRLHRRWAYPLWWSLFVDTWDWALPLRITVRPWHTDGSGRRGHVAVVDLSLLCLHWTVHYAWGRRTYRLSADEILSLREVLERDRAWKGD